MVVNIISKLQELGLSEYEARAYLALLQSHPVSAYEAAKLSGIPSSKIYQVLDRLSEKGIVMEMLEQSRKRYIPLDAEELVKLFRDRMKSTLNGLEKDLRSLPAESRVSYIWNISDYEDLLLRARTLITSAKKQLLLSAWNEELHPLEEALRNSEMRGTRISIVHFGAASVSAGIRFGHPIQDTLYQEKGGRGFTLVADSKEALVATVSTENRVEGAWSKNIGFVLLAEDYIKHDVYIMKIVRRFDEVLKSTFGENYFRLRDVFSDTEEEGT